MTTTTTPLGAVWRGALAGAAGCATMDAWFAAFGKLMPPPREGAFEPPEAIQQMEMPPETLARRVVGGVAKRGELQGDAKHRAGRIVHYAYGAGWGALYGILAETFPPLKRTPGALGWGAVVWSASDHLLLPLLRLGPWPRGVTPKGHAFWLASHLAFASGLGAAYRALGPHSLACAVTASLLARAGLQGKLGSRKPGFFSTLGTRLRAAVPA